jgi:hypothetical protein
MSKREEGLDFDGMAGTGVNRSGDRFSGNHYGATMPERVNKTYNKGTPPAYECKVGKSVTKDGFKPAPDTAKGGKINGGATVKGFGNPDKINVGNK